MVAATLREWKVDVVYTNTLVVGVGAAAALLTGLPHVWHVHEFMGESEALRFAMSRVTLSRIIKASTNIMLFNSCATQKEWMDLISAGMTRVVYNYIPAVSVGPRLIANLLVA